MNTFDNVKETITNKIDELKDEVRKDSAEQSDQNNYDEKDVRENPDKNTEVLNGVPEDDLIVEQGTEDHVATDYDLVNDVNSDETYDSGMDNFEEPEKDPDFSVVDGSDEYDSYNQEDQVVLDEERIHQEYTVQDPDEDENRIEEVDDFYQSSEQN